MTLIPARNLALTGCFTDDSDLPREISQDGPAPSGDQTDEERGIGVYDTRTQPWRRVQTLATPNPSWLVCHPGGHVLYAVNEVEQHEGSTRGAVQVYAINTTNVEEPVLTPLATRALAPGATGPTHVAVDPTGQFLVVSCYSGGQFNVFELDSEGLPGEVIHAQRPQGRSVDPERQQAPHAHHATCSPKGDFWLTCDLGRDCLTLMRIEQGALVKTDEVLVTPGAGARHAVFHPVQPWIYVVTEMHATLVQLGYDRHQGTLVQLAEKPEDDDLRAMPEAVMDEPIFDGALFGGNLLSDDVGSSEVSLVPDDYHGEKSGAGIVMHPSGRWLYASTRRGDSDHVLADSISAWAVDEKTGALSLIERYCEGLAFPRAIALSPTGDTLYALNQKGGSIVAMKICADTGALGEHSVVAHTSQPTCLVWPTSH